MTDSQFTEVLRALLVCSLGNILVTCLWGTYLVSVIWKIKQRVESGDDL